MNNLTKKIDDIFKDVPVYVYSVSLDGEILNTKDISLGYDEKDLVGEKISKIFSPDQSEVVEKLIKKLNKEGELNDEELTVITKEGIKRKVLVSASVIKDNEDEKSHSVFVLIDITGVEEFEKERSEYLYLIESLNEINEQIQKTNDMNQMLTDVLDSVLELMKSDRAWFLFPCDPNAETWTVPMERFKPEYPGLGVMGQSIPVEEGAAGVFRLALENKEPVAFDPVTKRYIPTSDRFGTKSQLVMAIYPKIGKPWLFGVHQCSHERIWTEADQKLFKEIGLRITDGLTSLLFLEDLKKSEGRFKLLIESAPILIIQIDPNYKILEFNKEAERIYGVKKEKVLGLNYLELFVPEYERKGVIEDIAKVLEGKETRGYENAIVDSSGEKYSMLWSSGRVVDSKGKAIGIIAIGQDITELKKTENSLKEKMTELERINNIMTDREIKMIALKKELEELKGVSESDK